MFLIEYRDGSFVNAEFINRIELEKETILFTVLSDPEPGYFVSYNYRQSFLNHLQALNGNISNVEHSYNEALKTNPKP